MDARLKWVNDNYNTSAVAIPTTLLTAILTPKIRAVSVTGAPNSSRKLTKKIKVPRLYPEAMTKFTKPAATREGTKLAI